MWPTFQGDEATSTQGWQPVEQFGMVGVKFLLEGVKNWPIHIFTLKVDY